MELSIVEPRQPELASAGLELSQMEYCLRLKGWEPVKEPMQELA
jgi:hypothetical protein